MAGRGGLRAPGGGLQAGARRARAGSGSRRGGSGVAGPRRGRAGAHRQASRRAGGQGRGVPSADASPQRRRQSEIHKPPDPRSEPVPPPARAQPGQLVPVGRRGVRARETRGQADLPLGRLLDLPLVPRHGGRVVRRRGDRAHPQRALHRDQGRSRGATRHRRRLHERRPVTHRVGWVADERVADARAHAVLRRNVFPASRRRPRRAARFPHAAHGAGRFVPRRSGPCRDRGDEARGGGPRGARRGGVRRRWPRPAARRRPTRPSSRSSSTI